MFDKYKIKVFKKTRTLQIRSKSAQVNQKITDLGSTDIRELYTKLALEHFDMVQPHVVNKSCRFFLTGTDTLVDNPADKKYVAGDYEPVLEILLREQ